MCDPLLAYVSLRIDAGGSHRTARDEIFICNVVPKSCISGEIFQATRYPISCSGPLYELPKWWMLNPKLSRKFTEMAMAEKIHCPQKLLSHVYFFWGVLISQWLVLYSWWLMQVYLLPVVPAVIHCLHTGQRQADGFSLSI